MDKITEFNKLITKTASQNKVELPSGYKYRYAPYDCWKCGANIIIFKWGNSLLSGSIKEPPKPMPKTLAKRSTAMSGETYWANVCANCDSVQGDFHINSEPDSPLFPLNEITDSKEAFDEDMKRMADYYYGQIAPWPQ